MNRIITIVFILQVFCIAFSQTNPDPQPLPYLENFSELAWASTAYPNGTQGWVISNSPGTTFKTNAPTGNRALLGSSTAASTGGSLHNYNGCLGFLNTNTLDLGYVFSLNTSGKRNIWISYTIMTIRNPYGYASSNRINEAIMQYRTGTTGDFANLPGTEYQNNTTQRISGAPNPQNPVLKSLALPAVCDDQAIVQLRILSRQVSGTGTGYPSFAIDNISVVGDDIVTTPIELSSFTAITTINGQIELHWITQSETGMQGFYIHRSEQNDLNSAQMVSSIIQATNSSQPLSYYYLDTELFESGDFYYWLQDVSFDGSTGFHGPVSVHYNPSDNYVSPDIPQATTLLSSYPNPFNSTSYIPFYLDEASSPEFRIFNSRGQLVRSIKVGVRPSGMHSIVWDGTDSSDSPCGNGTYTIRMDTGNCSYFSKVVLSK